MAIDFLAVNEIYDRALRDSMTATAPACPNCGENALVAESPDVDKMGRVEANGDLVRAVLEIYRCRSCGERALRKIELDRITREEREQEVDKAVHRAELRRELYARAGIFSAFRRVKADIEDEVQRQYPRREEPDLFERWKERRGSA
jgi:predicted RNA-binding Zn-ribbon protein involved in translation (DUF1610 family)